MLAFTDTGSGLPLVLLHAFPFDRRMWKAQESLPNVRLVCPDLPGFGESPVVESTVDSMADAVAELLQALFIESCVLGGCSMGGYVALAFARRHANRLKGLALVDTKAEPDDDAGKANRQNMIDSAATLAPTAVIDGMIPKALCDSTRTQRPEVVETVRRLGTAQSVAGIVAAQRMMRDRPDSRPSLGAIGVPTLVIVGEHDAITPVANAKSMADVIPGARLAILPDAGHLPNLETPIAFNETLSIWLKEVR